MAADGTSFRISSPELTAAGRYIVAAVFEETRPELVRAIGKRDALMRSAALELHVQPRQPATLLMLGQVGDNAHSDTQPKHVGSSESVNSGLPSDCLHLSFHSIRPGCS